MKDIKSKLAIVHLLDAQDSDDTDVASAWLDTKGFNGALIVVNVGAITGIGATASLTPVLQESDSPAASGAETVDPGSVHGAFTKMDATSEDQVTQVVGYAGAKRYVRVNLDYAGTDITAALVSVDGILGRPDVLPAVAPAPVAAT